MDVKKKVSKRISKNAVFTVLDDDNQCKPIVYCRIVPTNVCNDKNLIKDLVKEWLNEVPFSIDSSIDDVVCDLYKYHCHWEMEQYCLELTVVDS